jgi:hypothetical protein
MDSWAMLDRQERFVFNKLLTGSFRVGVSQNLVIKALADITGMDAPTLTHRIMGSWMPEDYTYDQLIQEQNAADNISRPYPFFLAYPIQETSEKQKSAEDVGACLRRCRRMAGRMEMGRYPRANDKTWWRNFYLEPRRRSGYRKIPRAAPFFKCPAGWHRD